MDHPSPSTSADCIFCKITTGTVPAHKVYEDDAYLAFLDIRPLSSGHTLIIPKQHHRWVWDVQPIGRYFEVVQRVAKALQQYSGSDEVHMKVVGEEVPHAHVWVYVSPQHTQGDARDFETHAAKLRSLLT